MSDIPSLPPALEARKEEVPELRSLRGSVGYEEYLRALDDLRGLNYLDILNQQDPNAILIAVGEGRALNKVRGLLDDRISEGAALAAEVDAAVERLRQEREAVQRAYAPRPETRFRRPVETG